MSESVLDASAVLAYLNDENGAGTVEMAIAAGCLISAVNWAEVLTKVHERAGIEPRALEKQLAERGLLGQLIQVVSFEPWLAAAVAELRPATRHLGLSLADRACLAFARALELPVYTADRNWGAAALAPLEIRLIR